MGRAYPPSGFRQKWAIGTFASLEAEQLSPSQMWLISLDVTTMQRILSQDRNGLSGDVQFMERSKADIDAGPSSGRVRVPFD